MSSHHSPHLTSLRKGRQKLPPSNMQFHHPNRVKNYMFAAQQRAFPPPPLLANSRRRGGNARSLRIICGPHHLYWQTADGGGDTQITTGPGSDLCFPPPFPRAGKTQISTVAICVSRRKRKFNYFLLWQARLGLPPPSGRAPGLGRWADPSADCLQASWPQAASPQGERSYGLNRVRKPRGNRHNPFLF